MTRNDVKHIAARLNNPILLHALERHEFHGASWEDVINAAVVELARQNDYFLNQLIDGRLKDAGLNRLEARQKQAAGRTDEPPKRGAVTKVA
jgi:hypothetical protein